MRIEVTAAFIAALGLSTAAEAQAPAPACATPKVAGEKLDLKQVPGTDLVTVPVTINGTPKQFLLDIGSEPDAVAPTLVSELHLPGFDQNIPTNAFADQNTPYALHAAVVDVKSARADRI